MARFFKYQYSRIPLILSEIPDLRIIIIDLLGVSYSFNDGCITSQVTSYTLISIQKKGTALHLFVEYRFARYDWKYINFDSDQVRKLVQTFI